MSDVQDSLQLVKGQKIELEKLATPGTTLNLVSLGLGWDTNSSGGADFDLDATALGLNAAGKLINDKYVVGYPNAGGAGKKYSSPCGGITHTGDNLTGEGEGDDETIALDLSKIASEVEEIVVLVDIYKASERGQNFGQVRNARVRVLDHGQADKELAKLDLGEDASTGTAIQFCRIYRHNGSWKFDANWAPYTGGGLAQFINDKK